MQKKITPIDCRKCVHYEVTWDRNAPHGCRAFGFKGATLPIVTVRRASPGMDCTFYTVRAAPKKQ